MTPDIWDTIRRAAASPPEATPSISYSGVLEPFLRNALGPVAFADLAAYSRYRADALESARAGDLTKAEDELRCLERFAERSATAAERLFVTSNQLSARSYVTWKRGDPDQARALISEALSADLELVDGWGLHPVELHRVQLARNRETIERTQSDGVAGELLLPIAGYLAGDRSWPPALGPASTADLGVLPAGLLTKAVDVWASDRAVAWTNSACGARVTDVPEVSPGAATRFPMLGAIAVLIAERGELEAQLRTGGEALLRGPSGEVASWNCIVGIVGRLALQSCTAEGIATAVHIQACIAERQRAKPGPVDMSQGLAF